MLLKEIKKLVENFKFEPSIDPNDVEFQVGRYLYEAQLLHADVTAGVEIAPERIKEVCERYCRLISLIGHLRWDYEKLMETVGVKYESKKTEIVQCQ